MSKDTVKYPVIDIAMSRVGHQYGQSTKYRQFIKGTLKPLVDLQNVLFGLLDIDLDTAKGIKLDLIGRLVGAPAVIPRAVPQPFFGYFDQEQGQEFGELDDPEAGGFWRELGQPSNSDYVVPPDEYRVLVDAQIIKNKSNCSPDEIIKIAKMILGDGVDFKYIDYPMAIILTPLQYVGFTKMQTLKAMIPKPSGVAYALLNGRYEDPTFTDSDLTILYDEYYY